MPKESFPALNLTTKDGVVSLMGSSKSRQEWDENADKIKEANQIKDEKTGKNIPAYPSFWWEAVVRSGLMHRVTSTFDR